MEQKDYKLEIICELLKGSDHIRAIAKKLETNHMNIVRKVKELHEANVVDYTKKGKNYVYFIKKTIEAQNYAFLTEIYKLNKILEKYPNLRSIIEKIQKNKSIKLSLLFGSYAKGIAHKESDIDVYIDTINVRIKKEIELIDSKINIKIGKYNKDSL